MISKPRSRAIGIALVLATVAALGAPGTASAAGYGKVQCVEADDQAQSLRREGKLTATRAQLAICSDPTCPGLVRDDCAQRLDELDRAQPSIVFEAKDGAGNDLTGVKVTIDGLPLAEQLDGSSLKVDPGEHTFVFTPVGPGAAAPLTKSYVIHENEKGRRERVLFAPASAPPSIPVVTASSEASSGDAASPGRGQRMGGIILGAAGIVGVGIGAIFGATASSSWSKAQSECSSSTCGNANYTQAVSDRNGAESAATASTIGFVAGGVLLAGGVVVFLTAPRRPRMNAALTLAPGVAPGGGGMFLRGSF